MKAKESCFNSVGYVFLVKKCYGKVCDSDIKWYHFMYQTYIFWYHFVLIWLDITFVMGALVLGRIEFRFDIPEARLTLWGGL